VQVTLDEHDIHYVGGLGRGRVDWAGKGLAGETFQAHDKFIGTPL